MRVAYYWQFALPMIKLRFKRDPVLACFSVAWDRGDTALDNPRHHQGFPQSNKLVVALSLISRFLERLSLV